MKDLQHEKRMAWWHKAKFGIFIHWGLYSLLGGEWKGKKEDEALSIFRGFSEWIMDVFKISESEYSKTAEKFNPINFNPDEWAGIIKESGAKYVIFTAKHHDGFSMFDSKLTNYNIVNATPFKRDIVKELSEAVRKAGLKFGIYYSILDWHFAKDPKFLATINDFDRYMAFVKGQLKELLTKYGKISVLFFDGDWIPQWNKERSLELLRFCREVDKDVIINDRIEKRPLVSLVPFFQKYKFGTQLGDYDTAEQFIPIKGHKRDWETEMTMNHSWGYRKSDHNWKDASELIGDMIRTFKEGGDFLLNIGPDGKGNIPKASIDILKKIGEWVKINIVY